ncbi:MAG: NAD-dependent epimerase/dehydratase family protein [Bacteroidota bacterium]
MFKILITGGAGFIASSLADKLTADKNNYVVAVDNFLTGKRENLPQNPPPNYQFLVCDVNDFSQLSVIMLQYNFDYVFHYAAVVGVQRTLQNPLTVLDDIQGLKNVLNLSKETKVTQVFFSSSSEVYGEPVEFPQNEETTPLNSKLPYAVVKNLGEAFMKVYQKEYGLNYTVLRFFNTYGARQSSDFVIAKFLKLANNNDDIPIYGDGSQTRTFCHIEDNLEVIVKLLQEKIFVNEVINIGSEVEISILDLAKLIIKATKSSSKIVYLPALKEGDMTRRMPDITKMKSLLKKELIPLRDGIHKIIA